MGWTSTVNDRSADNRSDAIVTFLNSVSGPVIAFYNELYLHDVRYVILMAAICWLNSSTVDFCRKETILNLFVYKWFHKRIVAQMYYYVRNFCLLRFLSKTEIEQ